MQLAGYAIPSPMMNGMPSPIMIGIIPIMPGQDMELYEMTVQQMRYGMPGQQMGYSYNLHLHKDHAFYATKMVNGKPKLQNAEKFFADKMV